MFSCDIQKAILNFDKHGVSFEEAVTAFDDEDGLDWADLTHSGGRKQTQASGKFRHGSDFAYRLHDKEFGKWQRNNPYH